MKILYLTMATVDETSGVYKKIRAQINSLRQLGNECRALFLNDEDTGLYLINDEYENINIKEKMLEINEYIASCDFCYARFELLRHKNYKSIINICKKFNIDIVLEIPTFPPYQESLARVKGKIAEKHFLSAVKTLMGAGLVSCDMMRLAAISKLVCIVADDYKFKATKTIRIENGIDLNNNPYSNRHKNEIINIVAVSNFAIWNGYDRAIKGLKDYVQMREKTEVKLILVGPLDNAPELQRKVEEYGLKEYVEFTGALSGKKLNDIYDRGDIALGALGNHRRKVFANSSLKAKEYAARGMLMVLSDAEGIERDILEKSFIVKSDESPLDYEKILSWYKKIENRQLWRKQIHQFAKNNYSWDYQMKKIMENYARYE